MPTFRKFEEIEAWQMARELAREVYAFTKTGDFSKDFGLRDQIRSATVSIMSNIAEGFERGGTREFVQFLSIAKGSVAEVQAQLYVALDQRYIPKDSFDRAYARCGLIQGKIGALMSYLRRAEIKGTKYKK